MPPGQAQSEENRPRDCTGAYCGRGKTLTLVQNRQQELDDNEKRRDEQVGDAMRIVAEARDAARESSSYAQDASAYAKEARDAARQTHERAKRIEETVCGPANDQILKYHQRKQQVSNPRIDELDYEECNTDAMLEMPTAATFPARPVRTIIKRYKSAQRTKIIMTSITTIVIALVGLLELWLRLHQ